MMRKFIFLILLLSCLLPCASSAEAPINYNDPSVSKEVNTLRKFRDLHLKKYEAGRAFITYYYKYGPIAATAIGERENLKSLVRLSLLPLMYAGKNFNGVLVSLTILLIFAGIDIVWYLSFKIRAVPVKNKQITVIYK